MTGTDEMEIWRGFDWYGSHQYCFPGFTISLPTIPGAFIKYRHAGRLHEMMRGVLMTVPNQVFDVPEHGGPTPADKEPVLIAVVVPAGVLTEDEQSRLQACAVEPGLYGTRWERELLQLTASLMGDDLLPCEKEASVRAFIERALSVTTILDRPRSSGGQRAVERAREYLHANFDRRFALDDVARETGLTKWYLARSFRRAIGIPIGEYARHLRAHRALQRLRRGARPVDVAMELNYSDQAHLTRELRAMFGFTPGGYARRAARPYLG